MFIGLKMSFTSYLLQEHFHVPDHEVGATLGKLGLYSEIFTLALIFPCGLI